MLIELKNGKRKEFKPAIAKVLIAKKLGKSVELLTKEVKPAPVEPQVEISPRTGLPKRQYHRRDLRAED